MSTLLGNFLPCPAEPRALRAGRGGDSAFYEHLPIFAEAYRLAEYVEQHVQGFSTGIGWRRVPICGASRSNCWGQPAVRCLVCAVRPIE